MLISAQLVGLLATLTLIGTSMAMNAIYLMGQGKTTEEAYVFLALSLAADAWKAVLPVLIAAAWQARRRLVAVAGGLLLSITLAFSFGSALGYRALELEMAGTAERQRLEAARLDVDREMARLVAAGAGQDSDAQVGFIVRMTGYASPVVRDMLIVAVAVVVEFGSAFGLLITGLTGGNERGGGSIPPAIPVIEARRDVRRRIGQAVPKRADRNTSLEGGERATNAS